MTRSNLPCGLLKIESSQFTIYILVYGYEYSILLSIPLVGTYIYLRKRIQGDGELLLRKGAGLSIYHPKYGWYEYSVHTVTATDTDTYKQMLADPST